MPKLKPEYHDPRLPGEHYTCDFPDPFNMNLDTIMPADELWSTCLGSHQDRPCVFRFGAIATWHLDDPQSDSTLGATIIRLFRYV